MNDSFFDGERKTNTTRGRSSEIRRRRRITPPQVVNLASLLKQKASSLKSLQKLDMKYSFSSSSSSSSSSASSFSSSSSPCSWWTYHRILQAFAAVLVILLLHLPFALDITTMLSSSRSLRSTWRNQQMRIRNHHHHHRHHQEGSTSSFFFVNAFSASRNCWISQHEKTTRSRLLFIITGHQSTSSSSSLWFKSIQNGVTATAACHSARQQTTTRTLSSSRIVLRQQQQQQQQSVDSEGGWIPRRSRNNAPPRRDNNNDDDDANGGGGGGGGRGGGGGWDDVVDDDSYTAEKARSNRNSGPSRIGSSGRGGGTGTGGWDDFEPFSSVPSSRNRDPFSRSSSSSSSSSSMTRSSNSSSGKSSSSSSSSSRRSTSPASQEPSQKRRAADYGDRGYSNSNWQDENTRRPGSRNSSGRHFAASENSWSNDDDRKRDPYPRGRGGGGDGGRGRGRGERFNRGNKEESSSSSADADRRINMRALEGAGFVHLYGLAPVLNALHANRRDFSRAEDGIDLDLLQQENPEALAHELKQRERKPEAQFSPCLFVLEQEYLGFNKATKEGSSPRKGRRSADKAFQAQQIQELARKRGLAIAPVDKGVLNTLSQNRPHQGYVLRCGKLDFEPLSRIPHADKKTNDISVDDIETSSSSSPPVPRFWLVLDEVVDPQNLGALLRSAYFLGGTSFKSAAATAAVTTPTIGVLVCAKNSAPPSPTVSASSAGALELLHVYSTSNLPRTLAMAEADGFRIIGAAASLPQSSSSLSRDRGDGDTSQLLDVELYDLQDLPPLSSSVEPNHQPTLLVLGSEGHGLRNLVGRSCTEFVRIPGMTTNAENTQNNDVDSDKDNDDDDDDETDCDAGVDSLNVSVTGGILLWHLLRGRMPAN